ncbi:MAG: filamentous hemagglutinin N-terminal domain-containing protein [Leptolyngbyaceae cyanobacterium]
MAYLSESSLDRWHCLRLAGLISLLGLSLGTTVAQAQVVEDNTLPAGENTVVNQNGNVYEITEGATRDANLFHSFEQFSLEVGQEAFFIHSEGIDTILGRVIGGSASNIDGLIRTPDFSTADIFLINPQGVIFGPNASLDVGGSFIASTAEQITFADGTAFNAADTPTVSLTVSQPVGLGLGQSSLNIRNEAFLEVPTGETLALVGNGIEFAGDGSEFEIVEEVTLPAEIRLFAPAGHIALASVAPGSTVNFLQSDTEVSGWVVDFDAVDNIDLRDIELSNTAVIDVSSSLIKDGGDIAPFSVSSGSTQLLGRQITIDSSVVLAANLGPSNGGSLTVVASDQFTLSGRSQVVDAAVIEGGGGDIKIDVSQGNVELVDTSTILVESLFNAGAAGAITIDATNLSVQDGSRISNVAFGQGDGGNITIDVEEGVELIDESKILAQSESFQLGAIATGAAGDLTINASRLSVQEGSEISTSAFSEGAGGTLTINALGSSTEASGGTVELLEGSRIQAQSEEKATGAAGELTINTSHLSIQEGSEISTSTLGEGAGGKLTINALDEASGGTIELSNASRIIAQADATGAAGGISVNTSHLSIQEGSEISTSTFSEGNGGTLIVDTLGDSTEASGGTIELSGDSSIRARSEKEATAAAGDLNLRASRLSVQSGSDISTATFGEGAGGTLNINTLDGSTEVIGVSPDNETTSLLSAATEGTGTAGRILIDTGSLLVQDGGQIQSGTFGTGSGSLTRINAESITVIGELEANPSTISAAASNNAIGADQTSGSIEIETGRLLIQDEAAIFTSTRGAAQGGELFITADEVILSGEGSDTRGLFARTGGTGDSGTLTLDTDTLLIEGGARLSVSAANPANIAVESLGTVRDADITANTILLDNGEILAESPSGNGGNLNLTVEDLIALENGSLISATAGTADLGGNGGDITISSPDGFVIALPDANSDIIANAFEGNGGNIDITATGVFGFTEQTDLSFDELRLNDSNDLSASSEFRGDPGVINVNALVIDPSQGLVELETEIVNPETLISTSCLAVARREEGRYVVTGSGGLPPTPADSTASIYTTGDVQLLPTPLSTDTSDDRWQHGDPIVEPDSVTRLTDGRIAFRDRCEDDDSYL